jgi:hypothetical protein
LAAQISVIFILPETKGISLERMDKIFGEVDAVEVGEHNADAEKIEVQVYSHVENKGPQHTETIESPHDTGDLDKKV